MVIRSRSNVTDVHCPPNEEVVIDAEDSTGKLMTTASTIVSVGLRSTTCSLAEPPSVKSPSPVVGIVPLVQLQVFQLRSLVTVALMLAQGAAITSCPEIT